MKNKFKAGDKFMTKTDPNGPARVVVQVLEHGMLGGLEAHGKIDVWFYPWDAIVTPPAPKAKPGVLYSHSSNRTWRRGFGLEDGRIYDHSLARAVDFDPAWEEFPL